MARDILDEIIENKRTELIRQKQAVSPAELRTRIMEREPCPKGCRSLRAALSQSKSGIIAEFKRKSPSKGWIHPEAKVADVLPTYERSGAAACSILTDSDFFGGSLGDLREARSLVKLPLLRKDFIIDSITVMPSRHLSSEEDLALISDEGYSFIAYSAWMSEITGSEYSCKAKMRLSETEIVKTGKTGAPKKYRNISTKTRVFRQEQILMTDIETDEREAFDLYERRLWLEDEIRKLSSTDTLVIFLCLILIGYLQYKAGKEISLKQAILGASAIIVGTDNPSFLVTVTDLYIGAAKAINAQTLRKTMSTKQINELFATKLN